MYTDRRAILSLVAQRRITPAEAERLLAVCYSGREVLWLLAGCVAVASLAQLQPHALFGFVHLLRTTIEGSFPALHHALSSIAARNGGTL